MLQHGWTLKTYAKWKKPHAKGKILMTLPNEIPNLGKLKGTESRLEVPGAGKSRSRWVIVNWVVFLWRDEKVLETVAIVQHCECI